MAPAKCYILELILYVPLRVVCMYHDLAVDLKEAKAALNLLTKHESGLQKIQENLSNLESTVSQIAQDTEGLLQEELESQVATCEVCGSLRYQVT